MPKKADEQAETQPQPEPDTRNIYQRILDVMCDVKYVQKDGRMHKDAGGYKFVSHDAVMAAVRPALVKHGIVVISTVADIQQDGNRTMVKMLVRFVCADDPTRSYVEVLYPGYGIDKQDKGPGKAISYAVKYALLKTLCLETGEDADGHNEDYKPPEHPTEAPQGEPSPDGEPSLTSRRKPATSHSGARAKEWAKLKALAEIVGVQEGALKAHLKDHGYQNLNAAPLPYLKNLYAKIEERQASMEKVITKAEDHLKDSRARVAAWVDDNDIDMLTTEPEDILKGVVAMTPMEGDAP